MAFAYYDKHGTTGVSGLWSVFAGNTIVDGLIQDIENTKEDGDTAVGTFGDIRMYAELKKGAEDVYCRRDTIENISDAPVIVNRCISRFTLEGGEYDVYTQAHGWENESEGAWQPLTSMIGSRNRGIRTCESAAPILALWNRQNGRGVVFHVFSCCAWQLTAAVEAVGGERTKVMVEAGLSDKGLNMKLEKGEKVELPQIVYYTFREKRDLECRRLHAWFNAEYPRKTVPVIFNTWMATFDRLNIEKEMHMADLAKEAGAEYFVVDAGWFGGDGRWHDNIGTWVENEHGAFYGRMNELGDYVRSLGMKFGFWLETERALKGTMLVSKHPEWFFFNGKEYFLDFGNDEARKCITKLVCDLIDRLGIDFIKSDFNAAMSYDPTGSNFLKLRRGHEKYIEALRQHRKGIYLENCASGGLRMEMYSATVFDSCWLSDNHSLYYGLRNYKDTLKRLPPCCIEKWPVLKDADGFMNYGNPEPQRKMIACDDAIWGIVRSVDESWLRAFMTGGPLGFSFDLTAVSQETRDCFKKLVEEFKQRRDRFLNGRASLLCDTDRLTSIEYEAENGESLIATYVWQDRQQTLTVYPHDGRELTIALPGKLKATLTEE